MAWATYLAAFLLGGWSHLLADLANDALVGWMYTGFVLDTWWAWPYVDSDAWYARLGWSWLESAWHVTPLEVGVIVVAMWTICSPLNMQ